jgi:hypothetical protein
MSPAARVAFLLWLAHLLLACPGVVVPVERPRVQVAEVSAVPDRAGTILVRMRLVVTNPNSVALSAQALDWEISLAGAPPWRGRTGFTQSPAAHSLPARAHVTWDIAVTIPAGVAGAMVARLRSGARGYQVSGTLHFTGPRGDISGFIDEQGAVTWADGR